MTKQQQRLSRRSRRGDQVPLSFAQPTARSERIRALLSAYLLRQPSEPLTNRLPFPLVLPPNEKDESSSSPSSSVRTTILVHVLDDDDNDAGGLVKKDFVSCIESLTQQSSAWFSFTVRIRSRKGTLRNNSNNSHEILLLFSKRWSRLMSLLTAQNGKESNPTSTDIFVVVGSVAGLRAVSHCLASNGNHNECLEERGGHNRNIRGILSFLSMKGQEQQTLPYLPHNIFHWIIEIHNEPKIAAALPMAAHYQNNNANLLLLTLRKQPSILWMARATMAYANAVQVTRDNDDDDDDNVDNVQEIQTLSPADALSRHGHSRL